MLLNDIIRQIDQNQQQIDAFGKFDAEILKKINYKFRLDWNYYSNRMEGGTLTREETRSVMVGNIDVKGKPLKDVMEMNGHDRTVLDILKMSKGEQRISEKRIKEIHKSIMYEEDPIEARQIGEWKTVENHVYNYKKEEIVFTAPADVPDKMHKLINQTNAELDKFFMGKKSEHPLIIAAQFHIDFVSIHPFYDGNGRTARILTNIILVSCGFPPMIIPDGDKRYGQLLADIQVYGGQPDLFYRFIGERLSESQQIVLRALHGEEIEDEEDLYKEIDLWKKHLSVEQSEVIPRTNDVIYKTYVGSLRSLFKEYLEKHQQFEDLFSRKTVSNRLNKYYSHTEELEFFEKWIDFVRQSKDIYPTTELQSIPQEDLAMLSLSIGDERLSQLHEIREMALEISYQGFKKNGINVFDEYIGIKVEFDAFHYRVTHKSNRIEYFKKLYSENLTKKEISKFVKECVQETFDRIKEKVDESKNI
jgi:hypothetical protein